MNVKKKREDKTQNQVFVSYSHKDIKWLRHLKRMLKPAIRDDKFQLWDDKKITAGDKWREMIADALSQAKASVLLVSDNFLASDFISENELPPLLEKEKSEGLKILWIAISSCLYKKTPIANYQALNNPDKPLDTLNTGKRKKELVNICEQILKIFETPKENRKQPYRTPAKIGTSGRKPKEETKKSSRKSVIFNTGKIRSKRCKTHENKLFEYRKSRDPIRNTFFTLKNEICEIDRNIQEKISKTMVAFISEGRGMVWIHPLVTKLKIYLRKGKYTDKYKKIKEGWGGYPLLSVSSDDMDLDYLKDLFKQAYNM